MTPLPRTPRAVYPTPFFHPIPDHQPTPYFALTLLRGEPYCHLTPNGCAPPIRTGPDVPFNH